jgi:hypothetical protein
MDGVGFDGNVTQHQSRLDPVAWWTFWHTQFGHHAALIVTG